tara:strand:- start:66 stop:461 length:396 start_codon:yes stop_codon:yes gene_type:complete
MAINLSTKLVKKGTIYLMSIGYIYIGIRHFMDVEFFMAIMPDYLPYHLELVYISGFFEVLLGVLLLIPKTRFYAGWGLILLLIAVFPANIYLVQSREAQEALGVTKNQAIFRLPFQAVFIALAYWHSKKDE